MLERNTLYVIFGNINMIRKIKSRYVYLFFFIYLVLIQILLHLSRRSIIIISLIITSIN